MSDPTDNVAPPPVIFLDAVHKIYKSGEVDVHADFDKGVDDAGVLADGAVALGAHAGVDEDLGHGVFGGGGLFALPGSASEPRGLYRNRCRARGRQC